MSEICQYYFFWILFTNILPSLKCFEYTIFWILFSKILFILIHLFISLLLIFSPIFHNLTIHTTVVKAVAVTSNSILSYRRWFAALLPTSEQWRWRRCLKDPCFRSQHHKLASNPCRANIKPVFWVLLVLIES